MPKGKPTLNVLLTTLLLGLAGAVAAAEMYKWTDTDGNVHYSQSPPPQGQFQTLKPNASATTRPVQSDTAKTAIQPAEEAPQAVDPEQEKREQQRKQLEADIAEYNCAAAREQIEIYKNYKRIQDTQGNISVLSDEERAAKIKAAEKTIKKYCH